jgi:hypothetical protein
VSGADRLNIALAGVIASSARHGLWPFDVSADDRRFLFSRPVGGQSQRPDELIVVENFIEELKAKVPAKR